MSRLTVGVRGVSIWGPGLPGWEASRAVLAGQTAYEPVELAAPAPAMLGATERRRAGPVVRLALEVARGAVEASGLEAGSLACVFGSSNGDGVVVGSILDALARAAPGERVVSPTQFHNSVHNAAAGYWGIAQNSRAPACCMGAHDATWPASLLKAVADVVASGEAVLLVCYDHPLPAPLDALRPTAAAFGAGLVLAPGGGRALTVEYRPGPGQAAPLPAGLEALRGKNSIAQALPLLMALAGAGGRHVLPYLDGHIAVEVGA